MTDRYVVARPIAGSEVLLDGPEAHHLIHVMRARSGAQVVLFDGLGVEFPAVVEQVGRSEVRLRVTSREPIDRELPLPVTLGVSLPKGDRQKWLVEKATELGVTRLVPLRTARSVAEAGPQALERLRRSVVEASKQCGRNRLMEIAEPAAWSDFIATGDNATLRLLAHPHATRVRETHQLPCNVPILPAAPGGAFHAPYEAAVLAVGPEGGFTDEEVALAVAAGWRTVDLGPRILRIETAALLLVAIVTQGSC
jgi:16S rRNA (uracil1498-N3)-methyltransferase